MPRASYSVWCMYVFNCCFPCCHHYRYSCKGSTLSLEPGCSTSCRTPVLGTLGGVRLEPRPKAFLDSSSFLAAKLEMNRAGTLFKPACALLLTMPPFTLNLLWNTVGRADVSVAILQERKLRPKVTFPRSLSKCEAAVGWKRRPLMPGPLPFHTQVIP